MPGRVPMFVPSIRWKQQAGHTVVVISLDPVFVGCRLGLTATPWVDGFEIMPRKAEGLRGVVGIS
jgi:hypothetical protein